MERQHYPASNLGADFAGRALIELLGMAMISVVPELALLRDLGVQVMCLSEVPSKSALGREEIV